MTGSSIPGSLWKSYANGNPLSEQQRQEQMNEQGTCSLEMLTSAKDHLEKGKEGNREENNTSQVRQRCFN